MASSNPCWAAGAPTLPGPGFAVVEGTGVDFGCGPRVLGSEHLVEKAVEISAELERDVSFVLVLTAEPTGCGDVYYAPVANDARGIGYARTEGTELFDDSPDSALEGVAFFNDLPYWLDNPGEFRSTFLHELGHRWGARVHASIGDRDIDLTGREGAHWSYFLDTDGSPLEGNRFSSTVPFETATPALRLAYSPLDLYLMGLLPPAEVGPIRLLDEGSAAGSDCREQPVTVSSPPQSCEAKTLEGQWLELSIDDVIRSEGARLPDSEAAPRSLDVAVVLLVPAAADFTEKDCEGFSGLVDARLQDFFEATGQRLELVNALRQGPSCAELVERRRATQRSAAGCSWTLPVATGTAPALFVLAAALLALRRGQRRGLKLKG